MSMSAQDLLDLRTERDGEQYVVSQRYTLGSTYSQWKTTIEDNRRVLRNEYKIKSPGGQTKSGQYRVPNIAHMAMNDNARMASATAPITRCDPEDNGKKYEQAAELREAVAQGYAIANNDDLAAGQFFLDLAGTGFAAICTWYKDGYDYPVHYRHDPLFCYPNIVFNEMKDMLIVQKMKLRDAAWKWKNLGLSGDPKKTEDCEVIEYLSENVLQTLVYGVRGNEQVTRPYVVQTEENRIGRVPVAWARLPSHDGQFRGLFDLLGATLDFQETIASLYLDHADRTTYGSRFYKGNIDNPEDDGPGGKLFGDENSDIRIVGPPTLNPQLLNMYAMVGESARQMAQYPAQRQGGDLPSIISSTGVGALQGPLTEQIRELQRHRAAALQDLYSLDFAIDETYLNTEKSLLTTKGGRRMYVPTEAIKGNHRNRTTYSIGAGASKLEERVAVLQEVTGGLTAMADARDQLSDIRDPLGTARKIQREAVEKAYLQATIASSSPAVLGLLLLQMEKGDELTDAVKTVLAQQQAEAAAAQGAPTPGAPSELPAGAPPAETTNLALIKGGLPGNTPNIPLRTPFSPPPTQQVLVR